MKTKDILLYVFSAVIILSTLVWFGILLFIKIPVENKDLITTAAGIFLGSGWTQILNWWFGSSKGSSDKNEILSDNKNESK